MMKLIKKQFIKNWIRYFGLLISLLFETGITLLMPDVLSNVIDNMFIKTEKWLLFCVLTFCLMVFIKAVAHILNTLISEKLGHRLCDVLREDAFKRILNFSVHQHKETKSGEFHERIEGDINILVGFLSKMLVNILSSMFLLVGVLVAFYKISPFLGIIFSLLSLLILLLFILTRNGISLLWKKARETQTSVLGEFTQAVEAYKDIIGMQKDEYILNRFDNLYQEHKKNQVRASFMGNIPSTVFYSILNIGEGIVLTYGVYKMSQGQLTIGDMYLLLSYIGLLNMPFNRLKTELCQLPKILAAMGRINYIYSIEQVDQYVECEKRLCDGRIVFDNVSFGYNKKNMILRNVSFIVNSGEKVLIEGRTGSGKSTILQLIAGLYNVDYGEIIVGGNLISNYDKEELNNSIFYIFQFNPIIHDSITNNLTRFCNQFCVKDIMHALKEVHLDTWLQARDNNLETEITTDDLNADEAQLFVWAAALLAKPKVLLVDEFDASVQDETIRIIDELINEHFSETTIVFVSHKIRSSVEIQKRLHIEEGIITGFTIN